MKSFEKILKFNYALNPNAIIEIIIKKKYNKNNNKKETRF